MSTDATPAVLTLQDPAAKWLDISVESWREYIFPNGAVYRISNPERLNVKRKPEGDSHRVVDALGVVHYIPAGWMALRWFQTPAPAEAPVNVERMGARG